MSNAKYTLKPAEVQKLIHHCTDLRERIIIRLMVHCGLRREETAGLLIDRIDWSRNRVSFVGKGRLTGIVPIPPDLVQDIRFFIAGKNTGFLFPARKKKNASLTITQINRIVSDIGRRAGIRSPNPKSATGNINPHLLRHTFSRLCKDSGLGTVSSVVCHLPQLVASRAGAWIETPDSTESCSASAVASRAGAWIETEGVMHCKHIAASPPARGRGLKRPGRFRTSRS